MAGVNLGFENQLWDMADKLRGNIAQSTGRTALIPIMEVS